MLTELDIKEAEILIVDDDETTLVLLRSILEDAGYAHINTQINPVEACEVFRQINPAIVILDLDMPQMNGFQVMEEIKKHTRESYLPVLIVTSNETKASRIAAFEAGAQDFLNKPIDRVDALARIRNMIKVRLLHNKISDQNKLLEERVQERTQYLYETQRDVIERLARAVEYRDSETGLHTVRMSHYAACLAAKAGLSSKECDMILSASSLHDIGKIGIPDSILRKPGKLSPEEWAIMKTHTTIGGELLEGSDSSLLQMAEQIALTHHEHWDGSGYPKALKGDAIPLEGRICGLCDVFDALTHKRPYKEAWPIKETVEEIKKRKGTQFDPALVDHLLEILPQIEHIRERYQEKDA